MDRLEMTRCLLRGQKLACSTGPWDRRFWCRYPFRRFSFLLHLYRQYPFCPPRYLIHSPVHSPYTYLPLYAPINNQNNPKQSNPEQASKQTNKQINHKAQLRPNFHVLSLPPFIPPASPLIHLQPTNLPKPRPPSLPINTPSSLLSNLPTNFSPIHNSKATPDIISTRHLSIPPSNHNRRCTRLQFTIILSFESYRVLDEISLLGGLTFLGALERGGCDVRDITTAISQAHGKIAVPIPISTAAVSITTNLTQRRIRTLPQTKPLSMFRRWWIRLQRIRMIVRRAVIGCYIDGDVFLGVVALV